MYDPTGNAKEKSVQTVQFTEAEPPKHLSDFVHRYLQVKTDTPLENDYRFHALPDACIYVVFDQVNPNITGVCKLQASSEELNLGKSFHYVNIRFLPGVWQGSRAQIIHGMINAPYTGELPLLDINTALCEQSFQEQQFALNQLVEKLIAMGLVAANPLTKKIFEHVDEIHSVSDMAAVSEISSRQLQRTLKRTTGFTPHDFLKILRLQQSLNGNGAVSYADQSHFIHSFRKATGYTPGQYSRKFDV